MVGLIAITADSATATPSATIAERRPRPVGRCPLGNTIVIPRSATNTRLQPQALHQASRFWNGLSLSVPTHSTGAVTWTLAIIRPQPIAMSSQPTVFLGRRLTSSAPIPAKRREEHRPCEVRDRHRRSPGRPPWSGSGRAGRAREARAGAPLVAIPVTMRPAVASSARPQPERRRRGRDHGLGGRGQVARHGLDVRLMT